MNAARCALLVTLYCSNATATDQDQSGWTTEHCKKRKPWNSSGLSAIQSGKKESRACYTQYATHRKTGMPITIKIEQVNRISMKRGLLRHLTLRKYRWHNPLFSIVKIEPAANRPSLNGQATLSRYGTHHPMTALFHLILSASATQGTMHRSRYIRKTSRHHMDQEFRPQI